jgi:uncharacterized protein
LEGAPVVVRLFRFHIEGSTGGMTMKCPQDGSEMDHVSRHGVEIDHCPVCGGVWLDRGELDHLIEAVRPAVALDNPDPDPVPPPPPPGDEAEPEGHRGHRYAAPEPKPKRAKRFEDRGRMGEPEPGKGRRFGGTHSRKSRVKSILEEIFDFD